MKSTKITSWYDEGALSKGDALSKLADLAAIEGVDATLQELPTAWRAELEEWIFEVYDNEVDSDDFLDFGDPDPDLEQRRKAIGVLREWIGGRKLQRSS